MILFVKATECSSFKDYNIFSCHVWRNRYSQVNATQYVVRMAKLRRRPNNNNLIHVYFEARIYTKTQDRWIILTILCLWSRRFESVIFLSPRLGDLGRFLRIHLRNNFRGAPSTHKPSRCSNVMRIEFISAIMQIRCHRMLMTSEEIILWAAFVFLFSGAIMQILHCVLLFLF